MNRIAGSLLVALIAGLILVRCGASPSETPSADLTLTAVFEEALIAATRSVPTSTPTQTTTHTPTPTATATATPVRTPPALPAEFNTPLLAKVDQPRAYITNACESIKARWSAGNAEPGTVVMPIMFHSVTDGEISHPYQITSAKLDRLLRDLKEQGFESITMQQLADFLHHNSWIPRRSVLLIADDLHNEEYFRKHFEPLLKEYGWTMVNAWISEPEASKRVLQVNQKLQQEQWVEHQAHGVIHNIYIDEKSLKSVISTELYGSVSGEEFSRLELEGSMQRIEEAFGVKPIAYIWPGGNFTAAGVKIAEQVGYQLGFSVNPRGPLMYNWIPLADQVDPNRPSFLPEAYVNNPLFVLPRYWDKDASAHIDTVRQIGNQAAIVAEQNKAIELEYYDIVCKAKYGDIPGLEP